LADKLQIDLLWIFGAWRSLAFIASVGWSLRYLFRSASFIVFFLAWLVLHLVCCLFVVAFLQWLYWIPALGLELWIGYSAAFWLFGMPAKGSPEGKDF
jgi:hypothetical protein